MFAKYFGHIYSNPAITSDLVSVEQHNTNIGAKYTLFQYNTIMVQLHGTPLVERI